MAVEQADLVAGTVGQGSAYVNAWQALGYGVFNFNLTGAGGIEVSSLDLTNDDMIIRAVSYGTAGNSIHAAQIIDSGATYAFTG